MKTRPTRTRRHVALRACLLGGVVCLTACGGSGGDDEPADAGVAGETPSGGSTDTDPEAAPNGADPVDTGDGEAAGDTDGNGANGPDAVASGVTFSWRALPAAGSSTAFETRANAQGAEGYRHVGPAAFGIDPLAPLGAEFAELFRDDESDDATYAAMVLPPASNASDFLAQADAMGREGFLYRGDLAFADGSTVSFYDRAVGGSARPTYETLEPAADEDSSLEQLNAQGARGYRSLGSRVLGTDGIRALYVRDAAGDDVFDYRALSAANGAEAFLEQANREGATGYRFAGTVAFTLTPPFSTLYLRNASSAGVYAYEVAEPANGSAEDFVAQAARFGDEGKLWIGDNTFGSADLTAARSLYVDLTRCDCESPLGPFGL